VLTVPNDRLLLVESDLDQAVNAVLLMMKSSDARDVGNLAGTVGAASIRKLYELSEDHYKYSLSAAIKWMRDTEVKKKAVSRLMVDAGQAADWYQDRVFRNDSQLRRQRPNLRRFVQTIE
jgi:hypothetical protein